MMGLPMQGALEKMKKYFIANVRDKATKPELHSKEMFKLMKTLSWVMVEKDE
jgi:hypothetical protein